MKSVLMIINYFYPDLASTSQLLTELCEKLENDFKITVICTVPSYTGFEVENDQWKNKLNYDVFRNNVNVIRIKTPKIDKSKKINRIKYASTYFILALYAALITKRTDVVFSISQPPILGGILGVITKYFKRNRFVYCIEDFNPEQIEAIKYFSNKIMIGVARFLDNKSCDYADKVIILGRDMQETLIKRNKNADIKKSVIINNWINEKKIYPIDKSNPHITSFLEQHHLSGKYIIMYSGNMGLFYDLENLIKVFAVFKDNDSIRFVFIGDGAKKAELVEYVKENNISNIVFLPYQPKETLIYSLNAADLHIVTNAKGIKGISVPSKVYGVMAVGRPVLGILENGSEAQMIIKESGCGVVVEPTMYDAVKSTLDQILNDKNGFRNKGANGRMYLEKHLSMIDSIKKYAEIFNQIGS